MSYEWLVASHAVTVASLSGRSLPESGQAASSGSEYGRRRADSEWRGERGSTPFPPTERGGPDRDSE